MACVGVTALLCGCTWLDQIAAPPQKTASLPPPARPAPPVAGPADAPAATARTPLPPPVRPTPPGAPAAPALAPSDVQVIGLTQAETQTLLGAPVAETDRPPAKVWRYSDGACVVEVYFYLDMGRNTFYALHYGGAEASAAGASPASAPTPEAANQCLRRVYNAHRQPR